MMLSWTLISCAAQTQFVNVAPDVYIADQPAKERGAGTFVPMPKGPIDMNTKEGIAQAKTLITDLAISDRRNARTVLMYEQYHKRLQDIYNKGRAKKKLSTSSRSSATVQAAVTQPVTARPTGSR